MVLFAECRETLPVCLTHFAETDELVQTAEKIVAVGSDLEQGTATKHADDKVGKRILILGMDMCLWLLEEYGVVVYVLCRLKEPEQGC